MSSKFDANYELPSIEHQEYLFREKYFSQELLSYKENEERKVSKLLNLII